MTPTFFSTDSVIGGAERYVQNVVHAVARHGTSDTFGFTQTIISVGRRGSLVAAVPEGVVLLDNIARSTDDMNAMPYDLWQALPGFELVHLHQALTGFGEYCAAILASLRIPFIATDLGGGSSALMLSGQGLELAARAVSISRYAEMIIRQGYSGPMEVVIGPVDTDFFRPGPAVATAERYAICVSRILPHKGIDKIISALPTGLALKVVGEAYDQRYFELLQNLARGKNVTFHQGVGDAELLKLYRGASIFLQASTLMDVFGNWAPKPELMGLTPLEAMACGLPVLLSNVGSLPELLPGEEAGRVFGSVAELKGQLEDFVAGRWPRAGAGELARSHVVDNYSSLVVGREFARIYRETAGQ